MSNDRLAEIEERYGGETGKDGYVMRHDITWLIDEIKDQRTHIGELQQQLADLSAASRARAEERRK